MQMNTFGSISVKNATLLIRPLKLKKKKKSFWKEIRLIDQTAKGKNI